MRWWIPLAIVALAAANATRIRLSDELDTNFKNMQSILTMALARTSSLAIFGNPRKAELVDWLLQKRDFQSYNN